MPRRANPSIEIRSGQGGRPRPPHEAAAQRDSERALPGALTVPIEQIVPDPEQPRKEMDPIRLGELAASLREYGLLQPLLVREDGALDDGRARYTIVAGGRRYAAAQLAGLTRLPVLVRDSAAVQIRILQLTENIQREALAAVEEARAIKELMDLQHLGSRTMAERLHCSHTYVNNRLKLLEHEDVAAALQPAGEGRPALPASVALEIAREDDAAARRTLIERARAERLRKEDVRLLRRRAVPVVSDDGSAAAGGAPTLRQVAAAMGATEEHISAAAHARKDEPALSLAEAVALAMHAPPAAHEAGVATAGAGEGAATAGTIAAAGGETLVAEMALAGGETLVPDPALQALLGGELAETILAVLSWARARGLSLDQLEQHVRSAAAARAV